MEEYAATIVQVEFFEPKTGFAVLQVDSEGARYRMVGEVALPVEGGEVSAMGEFGTDPKFGHCLIAAGPIVTDELDKSLAGAGVGPEKRREIAEDDSKSFNPFSAGLGGKQAVEVAQRMGKDFSEMVRSIIVVIMHDESGRYGVPERKLLEAVRLCVDVDVNTFQTAMQELYAEGEVVLTTTGFVVLGEEDKKAEEIADSIPPVAGYPRVDEGQFRMLDEIHGAIDSDLTEGERKAVLWALNHKCGVIDISSPARADKIAASVEKSLAAMNIDAKDDLIIYRDMDLVDAMHVHEKAMVDSGRMPSLKVTPKIETPIDEAMMVLGRLDHRLEVTCQTTVNPEEDKFRHEGSEDRSVWACRGDTDDDSLGALLSHHKAVGAQGCQVLTPDEGGNLGSLSLSALLSETFTTGVPLYGVYKHGDKVVAGSGAVEEVHPGSRPQGYGWAITVKQGIAAETQWPCVVLVVDEENTRKCNWRMLYAAMSMAREQFVVIGAGRSMSSLLKKPGRELRNEALYARLKMPSAEKVEA